MGRCVAAEDVFGHLTKIISKASNHQVGGLTNEMVFKVILNNGKGTSVDKARGKRFDINGLEDGMVPRI